jgi:signal transduction histidine kinase
VHRLVRSPHDRLLTGVAGGLAARFGVPSTVVRLLFVLLTLCGGVGVVLYVGCFAWSTTGEVPQVDPMPRRVGALCLFAAALVILCRVVGLWPGDGLGVPAVIAAGGAVLVWARASRGAEPFAGLLTGRVSLARLVAGSLLVLGALIFLAADRSLQQASRASSALALAAIGVVLVAGPWIGSLTGQLREAQRARIRSEEKAELAAHLHDSVLQTLALLQRNADDPKGVVLLARRQERELRAWLYGDRWHSDRTVQAGVERIAADVEADHGVKVDSVVVGDHPLDERAEALLGAVREAVVNAAKHAGVDQVTVFVEVEPEQLVAYVRDTGCGFVPDEVANGHHGIAQSINGRVHRAGGTATVASKPGAGTELELRVPRCS